MTVEAARDLIDTDPRRARDLLSELLERTERAVDDVRQVAHRLRPPALDALGLLSAIRVHAADQHRLPVTLDLPDELPALTAAVEMAAYHITLEALHNVTNHAGASQCTLRIRHHDYTLQLEIIDNGRGIPVDHHIGIGLSSMRERAAELGGYCTWQSGPHGGTAVRAVLPTTSEVVLASDSGA
jgi:signal transduction histidine kinase